MEFHFTIRIFEECDTKSESLRYVKIEVSLQIFFVYNLHEPKTSEPKLLRDLNILR